MKFFEKYRMLSKDVRAKRKAYYEAEEKVSVRYPLIELNAGSLTPMPVACISEYERVIGNGFNEDTPFCTRCENFKVNEICNHRKCDSFANNQDFVIARESYIAARNRRSEFVKQTLRGLVK